MKRFLAAAVLVLCVSALFGGLVYRSHRQPVTIAD